MKKYVIFLIIIWGCQNNQDCNLIKTIDKYEFTQTKLVSIDMMDADIDSLFEFIEKMNPSFNRNTLTQKQLASVNFLRFKSEIPEYEPMKMDYFMLNEEMCDKEKILIIALLCHNIITNGADFEINTSEDVIYNTAIDSIIKHFNSNQWIGQCGEYDAFAKKIYSKFGFETITVNPTLYGKKDSLGHIYTIVYSPYSKKYYPIDIQNNCYWMLNNEQLADFKTIIQGSNYSRKYIDTINGRKDVVYSEFIVPFSFNGRFLNTGKYKSISKSDGIFIYRTIIEPEEEIRPNNYMDRTSKVLNVKSPIWEDFIFKAGILNSNDEIKKELFYGDYKTLNDFWNSIE